MRFRFAPSPSGPLHLGHGFSALTTWDMACACGGEFLLRIEDIDHTRCRWEFETRQMDDLRWLGLHWPNPVMRQSERQSQYNDALKILIKNDLIYPCGCTRKDIKQALSAPQEGTGAARDVYPGTCRTRSMHSRTENDSLRLDMAKAIAFLGGEKTVAKLFFTELANDTEFNHFLSKSNMLRKIGDVILARRDIGTSYHLAVVVDDAAQKITHVTRGKDIFEATFIHRLLQALLDLPTPFYHHHRLIRDTAGIRLAKRTDAKALAVYRGNGTTPQQIRGKVGL